MRNESLYNQTHEAKAQAWQAYKNDRMSAMRKGLSWRAQGSGALHRKGGRMTFFCESLGHLFEPRYDEKPREFNANCTFNGTVESVREALVVRVYVRDVCTRCGKTVERVALKVDPQAAFRHHEFVGCLDGLCVVCGLPFSTDAHVGWVLKAKI